MPQWLKMLAVLCCLTPWLRVAVRLAMPEPLPLSPPPEMRGRGVARDDGVEKSLALAMLIVAELGAVLLMIDAFMRHYDAPRGWPIALAVMGLLTLGMTSLVYYAIWGRRPRRAMAALADDFCAECLATSRETSLAGAGTHNLMGADFLGHSARCLECGSSIRTLWLWILLPLAPLGSYRVLSVGAAKAHESQFRARRVNLDTLHVAVCYSFVAAIVVTIWWLATRQ